MTIYEIAKKAKVSVATVSRALNPLTRDVVAPGTFKKIEAAALKYGYTPNFAAQSLRRTSYQTIGVIIPHYHHVFFHDYYSFLLAGVADAVLDSDYRFKLIMLKVGGLKWDHYKFKATEGIDGIVVANWHEFFSGREAFQKLGLPVAAINDPVEGAQAFFVNGDNFLGGRLAGEYLYSKGHQNIGVITGHANSTDCRQRLDGFRSFFRTARKSSRIMSFPADFRPERAAQLAAECLLNQKKRSPTAFFCMNDAMAVSVIEKLRQLGIRCPKDISVMGYDDLPVSTKSSPLLTTVHVPIYDMAKEAAGRLIQFLKAGPAGQKFQGARLFSVRLVERESVVKVS